MELALTVVLLISAGLLLKSYHSMRNSGLGCATENVLTLGLSQPRHVKTPAQIATFYQVLLERVREVPGVTAAGAATSLPGQGRDRDDVFAIREHPPLPKGAVLHATTYFVDPGYFKAMQIPLIAGRSFADDERPDRANKVLVNQTLAGRFFKGEDPIGKHLSVSVFSPQPTIFEIVGVAADTRELPAGELYPAIYYPLLAGSANSIYLVVHIAGDSDAMAEPVKRVIPPSIGRCRSPTS